MKARLSLGIFIAVSVIVVSLVSLVFAYPPGWGEDIRLTFASRHSQSPSIAIDSNDNMHIVWQDLRVGFWQVYYTKVDRNGNTLVDDKIVTYLDASHPSITTDSNDNVHVVWHDFRYYKIYYEKLDNNGTTLVDDKMLTNISGVSQRPSIAIDSNNNGHIVWQDGRNGNDEIYYKKIDNNGNTLVDDKRVTFSSDGSHFPTLAIDSNNNVHVVWFEGPVQQYKIYYTKLDNNGNTLVDDTRLTSSYDSRYPSIATDSDNSVHIVWEDVRDGSYEIYYTKLDNNGNTLVDDKRLTFSSTPSEVPSLITDSNNNVHVVWADWNGYREIFYMKLDSEGNTLINTTRLTYASDDSYFPSVIKDSNNNVHVVWADSRDGNYEIYYKRSIPNGTCYDGILSGDEEGIDCGGSCPFVCGYCTPYIQNGNHSNKIDVVFIPDVSYGGNIALFLQHIGEIINNSFLASEAVSGNISKFNFYYISEEGYVNWSEWEHVPPENFFTECAFYDAAVMLHTDSHRDFSSGKIFSSEYYNYGTIMHEFGHALFGLADEYCCDSYYFVPEPFPNIYNNESFCRTDAINESWNPDDCDNFCPANNGRCGNGWWRSDPLPDIMEDDGDNIVPPFQRADVRNIYWTFGQYPDAGFRQNGGISRTALLNLIFENETINVTQIRIIYNNAPEHVALSGDLNLTTLDAENNPITSFLFWDPRIILTENESVYLPEGNTTIAVPLTFDEEFLDIYNSSGSLKLRINLTEQINNFCAYQDGFCDAACPNGIDLDCAPVLQHINNITAYEGNIVRIIANATDPNDENLTYSINDTRFEQNGNLFTWQTHFGDMGFYEVNVSVTDNYLEDSQIVDIRVYRPPKPSLPYILWDDGGHD